MSQCVAVDEAAVGKTAAGKTAIAEATFVTNLHDYVDFHARCLVRRIQGRMNIHQKLII